MLVGVVLVVSACGSGGGEAVSTATVGQAITTAPASSTTASSTTTSTPAAAVDQTQFEPAYDVFLVAVAEAVADTRFADVAFDDPDITVAAGLAVCEAISAGEDPDEIIAEFAADLTGGESERADDDQIRLTGAILGAAERALCPHGM